MLRAGRRQVLRALVPMATIESRGRIADASESACTRGSGGGRCRCSRCRARRLAGRLVATGHDADSHCSGYDGGGQCHFVQVAVAYVRGGAPVPGRPLLVLDCSTGGNVSRALVNAAVPGGPHQVVCPSANLAAFNGLRLTTATFSAIVVGSSIDALSLTDTAAINAPQGRHRDVLQPGRRDPGVRRRHQRRRSGRPLLPVRPDRDRRQGGHLAVPPDRRRDRRSASRTPSTGSARTTTSTAARPTTPSRSRPPAARSRSRSATRASRRRPRRCSRTARSAAARS